MTENRTLPDWIDGFMLLTDDSEPPVLFRKWTAISAIASALQRKVKLSLGISLTFHPNFYVVLVGPSATGKGTAMKYAYDIIEQVGSIRLAAQATSLQALIRRMKETNLTDVDAATGDQIFHSSLTVFSNEFTVFLGYKNDEMIASLCDWYDCPNRWVYDTIKRDKETIVGCWVNILGGTTPDNIQSSLPMDAIGGGLTSRIIFVNEDKKNKLVVFPKTTQREVDLQQYLINDLERISLISGSYHLSQNAAGIYHAWCEIQEHTPPFHDPNFDGYMGRRRNHLLSLAMVCHASKSDTLIVTEHDVGRAIELLAEVEIRMAMTFKGIGKSDISSLIQDGIKFFTNSTSKSIPYFQFARYFEGNMDKIMMDRVIDTLTAMNHIRLTRRPGMDTMIEILL